MRRSLAFLITVGLTCAGATAAQISGSDDPIQAALDDLASGKAFEAVRRLKQVDEESPRSGAAHFYLSTIYANLGEFEIAHEELEAALRTNPDQASFRYQLGVLLHSQGDRRSALSAFREAIRLGLQPRDEAAAWREIGDMQRQLLDFDAALDAYQTAVGLGPQDARNRLALGKFYLDLNEPENAVDELRAAVELNPKLPEGHASLGRALRRLGDTVQAVEVLKQGIQLNPADQQLRYGLGQSLMAMGRDDEAEAVIQEYHRIEQAIGEAETAIKMGTRQFEEGDLGAARGSLEQAVALAPSYSLAHRTLGEVLLAAGEPDRAVKVLKQALAVNPLSAVAYFNLGRAYDQTGKLDQALEATERAIVLDEGNAVYHRHLGELYLELGNGEQAEKAFLRADGLDADSRGVD